MTLTNLQFRRLIGLKRVGKPVATTDMSGLAALAGRGLVRVHVTLTPAGRAAIAPDCRRSTFEKMAKKGGLS